MTEDSIKHYMREHEIRHLRVMSDIEDLKILKRYIMIRIEQIERKLYDE